MPTFDASTVVDPLNYIFEPEVKGCKGVIPEPSSAQVQDFQVAHRSEILRFKDEMEITQDMSREEFMSALERTDPSQLGSTMVTQAKMHSDLCSNVVSPEQIMKLGHRKQIAFQRWLQKEVMTPEVKTDGGKNPGS